MFSKMYLYLLYLHKNVSRHHYDILNIFKFVASSIKINYTYNKSYEKVVHLRDILYVRIG